MCFILQRNCDKLLKFIYQNKTKNPQLNISDVASEFNWSEDDTLAYLGVLNNDRLIEVNTNSRNIFILLRGRGFLKMKNGYMIRKAWDIITKVIMIISFSVSVFSILFSISNYNKIKQVQQLAK